MSSDEPDFHAWTVEQARLLRSGRAHEADLAGIAVELEGMSRSERRDLRRQFAVLLFHLLKWEWQPGYRGRDWMSFIYELRRHLAERLAEQPSLHAIRPAAMAAGYRDALLQIDRETGQPVEGFSPTCPYSEDQVFDPAFYPGPL